MLCVPRRLFDRVDEFIRHELVLVASRAQGQRDSAARGEELTHLATGENRVRIRCIRKRIVNISGCEKKRLNARAHGTHRFLSSSFVLVAGADQDGMFVLQ